VAEGFEIIKEINNEFTDDTGKPYKAIRILSTEVLIDPFEKSKLNKDLIKFIPKDSNLNLNSSNFIEENETNQEIKEISEKESKEKEIKEKAIILETLQDLPKANVKPKENILFICKLNPITTEEDLSIIFYRFGNCKCNIIKNDNGESLCYGFIEFDNVDSCEEAYLKMDNTIIDDRRIHVDFSQSVSKEWKNKKKRKNNQNFTQNKIIKK
jgi:peptidyl-prolyl cis-trans isomerase-like 4